MYSSKTCAASPLASAALICITSPFTRCSITDASSSTTSTLRRRAKETHARASKKSPGKKNNKKEQQGNASCFVVVRVRQSIRHVCAPMLCAQHTGQHRKLVAKDTVHGAHTTAGVRQVNNIIVQQACSVNHFPVFTGHTVTQRHACAEQRRTNEARGHARDFCQPPLGWKQALFCCETERSVHVCDSPTR